MTRLQRSLATTAAYVIRLALTLGAAWGGLHALIGIVAVIVNSAAILALPLSGREPVIATLHNAGYTAICAGIAALCLAGLSAMKNAQRSETTV